MIFPLGADGERVRVPRLTLALMLLNVVVHLATTDRVARDERAIAGPGQALAMTEFGIEMKHRGVAGTFNSMLGLERTHSRDRGSFWWRFERGMVVPKSDPEWIEWDEARRAFKTAHRETLHYQYGFRRDDPTLAGLLAHGFLHGDLEHLLFNMLFLWAVGAAIEDAWGRKWFALLYAIGLLGSAVADFVFMPKGLDIPGVGASGAIAAVMGAMAVSHFRTPMRVVSLIPVPGYYKVATGWLLVPWIVQQLVASARADAHEQGIGFGAHIGGFFVGAALAGVLKLARRETGAMHAQREAERRAQIRQRHAKAADEWLARGRAPEAVDEMLKALEADPDDSLLRFRLVEALGLLSRLPEQRAQGIELLQRLWSSGEKERFALTWEYLSARFNDLPPALAHRAAPLLEGRDPRAAARDYARALQQAPEDPLASQSFRKFGDLLERLGETEKAARVRELGADHERRRRDRTLR